MPQLDGVTIQTDTVRDGLKLSKEERKRQAQNIASRAGWEAFGYTGIITSGLSFIAYHKSSFYKKNLGPSGRTALMFMPAGLAYALVSEQAASRLANPLAFADHVQKKEVVSKLAPHQRVANWIYTNPVQTLFGFSVPTVGQIMYQMMKNPDIPFSQKLLHTRVTGQLSIITALLTLVGFQTFMDSRGGLYMTDEDKAKERYLQEQERLKYVVQ